jgi:hypothetical protein
MNKKAPKDCKVTLLTQREMKELIKQLIDLGAQCQKSKSFLIVPKDGPALSVYDWAYKRAEKIYSGRDA